ncbi:unnamed protein product [Bursaphelenchus okinawaensis]|uniref:GATA-type domain-containing protein n=1 Tax=Bursaphelenchus okinawaensis TaxID=465554 RepID=A0A811LLD6_9BILA|nr:unnamed protein product [Bursaphelenchus okinawaensis]CAG9123564.1 unnamed protein product [Bursaphelenchus okinawaensis]
MHQFDQQQQVNKYEHWPESPERKSSPSLTPPSYTYPTEAYGNGVTVPYFPASHTDSATSSEQSPQNNYGYGNVGNGSGFEGWPQNAPPEGMLYVDQVPSVYMDGYMIPSVSSAQAGYSNVSPQQWVSSSSPPSSIYPAPSPLQTSYADSTIYMNDVMCNLSLQQPSTSADNSVFFEFFDQSKALPSLRTFNVSNVDGNGLEVQRNEAEGLRNVQIFEDGAMANGHNNMTMVMNGAHVFQKSSYGNDIKMYGSLDGTVRQVDGTVRQVNGTVRNADGTARHIDETGHLNKFYSTDTNIYSHGIKAYGDETYGNKEFNSNVTHDAVTKEVKPKRKPTQNCHKFSICSNCKTDTTTLWRRKANGDIECNACNLYFRKNNCPRPLKLQKRGIMKRARNPRQPQHRGF